MIIDTVKFDVVIGNPPYNKDLYLDFVQTGYQMLKNDGVMVMITPAKWQAKGGRKNEAFREQIVPHMKEIVYWPEVRELFEIWQTGGETVFTVDKNIHGIKTIKNICGLVPSMNTVAERKFNGVLNNTCSRLVDNIGKTLSAPVDIEDIDKYRCVIHYKLGMNITIESGNSTYMIKPIDIIDIGQSKKDTDRVMFMSSNKHECESYRSYMYCKLPRFLMWISLCTDHYTTEENWRFVPDPGAFDHIFTDAELYQKYGLTQDEINIIESVIKERK